MTLTSRIALALLGSVALTGMAAPAFAQSGEVNIYSYREQSLLQPLLDKFSEETGIKANVLYAGDGLLERVAAEGELSPADVVLTVDIGNLVGAEEQGLTQPITTPDLVARVPEAFRDDDANWTALSLRSRVFYVSKDRVDATALTYEDLASEEWDGRICTRPGDHAYNIGLIAHYIAVNGEEKAREWLTKVRDNLAFAPDGNDRAQVKSILDGTCDLAIVNTYYMGAMLNNEAEPEQKDWANSARIIYPNAEADGTQVNVAGGFIAKHAPNAENANALIAFLLSDEAQSIYADTNYEFPVVASAPINELVLSWGELKASTVPLTEVAANRGAAAALVDELKFNEGPQD
ncbi:MAG: extracellular solute-binding protein [Devosia sp.]|jgi:iron(III) transport system substrate-binding protein|uniref:extracellular solute-binding protein n=1 Tax=Devosia sp. XGJD_8 TaxID=3391187 RepID=UPI001D34BD40|nr:extracellular solute-binding protein [Alphaproteobacteria bacterium]MBU1562816.1 extracellular solute-binding protein [Alphaproteobacteria bacterium]MBU2301433.1 extracellular solute-binding protein [Alphaproteobacteria bacterium]MBU2368136.1 extracellular solute-binding protein [Alphaproteobacteria bacterium]